MNQTVTYLTPDISTGHCQAAIIEEVTRLDGTNSVVVDLEARLVQVTAEQIDDNAVIAAIHQAGYEAARATETPLQHTARQGEFRSSLGTVAHAPGRHGH